MHDDRLRVEQRVERILRERVRPARYAATAPLAVAAWVVSGEPVPVADAVAATYEPMPLGSPWGVPWSTTWLQVTGAVPPGWAGRRVEVVVDLGFSAAAPGFQAEAMAYDLAGRPIKGVAPRNAYVPVTGTEVGVLLEAAANPTVLAGGSFAPTPLGERATAGDAPLYRLSRVELAVLDEPAWQLGLDVEVLQQLMLALAETDPRRHEILRALERMLDVLDLADVAGTAAAARKVLAEPLGRPAHASAHRLSAVGHAHIDCAWLWPLRETRRKCARTFASVTALAADYPELVFGCSSAQQYAWVKEDHPVLFDRIKRTVASGQWAPVGGMWVESDANLPGGESLARQLVHGRRFFRDELGVDTREVWLPDSFGYTAAFPQLARLAGARWFLTQKLSWNETNRLPHHTFRWEGLDGTRILTHFPPVDTYNAELTGAELAHAVANYAEKGAGTRSLVPFGYGDGGGGPTREMLERARRLADLEGSPRVTVESPAAFFAAAEAEYPDAPVWSGELYFELHRGTYTSQAETKAGNRRCERLLREAELWAATAAVRIGAPYPYDELDELWKTVLLHQFHDILPGSSIGWVHREAVATHAAVAERLERLVAAATAALGGGAFNAGPYPRAEVVGESWYEAPALGAGTAAPCPAEPVLLEARDGATVLDNGLLRLTVDGAGRLVSVLDLLAGREVLAGPANVLQLHPDFPPRWDAWDLDASYRRTRTELTDGTAEVVERHPLAATVQVTRTIGTQRVRLTAGARRVDLETEVDWQQAEKVLKVAFPLDVHAGSYAAEVQFGHVHRPTHTNTSWEAARFEAYGHRWLHVAEPGYGVGLLTPTSYGHDAGRDTRPEGGTTTTVRLTLLRAPRFPDPRADRGRHLFRYALLAGADVAGTVQAGYAHALPLRVTPGGGGPALVTVDDPRVAVEAVKLADDRSGDLVVRLYEAVGGHARTTVTLPAGFGPPIAVDLLEEPLPDPALRPGVEPAPGGCRLSLRPFQIATLRAPRR
jgi:alpha-mannosidase